MTDRAKEEKEAPGRLSPNQKLLLRLGSFPNHVVRLILVLDGRGQAQVAVVEDMGKAERFGG